MAGLTIAYVLAAKLGLMMDAVAGFATLVWPASGLALAALFLRGNRLWPAIALGAFLSNLWTGAPLLVATGIAVGNTLEAVAGAAAIRYIPGFAPSLDRVRDALGLVLVAWVTTTISATLGVLSLTTGGIVAAASFAETWRTWWIGDALGDLVAAPLLLVWATKPPPNLPSARRVEWAALGLTLLAMGFLIFGTEAPTLIIGQAYFLYPLLIWAALRFGQRGAISATFLCSVIAITGTALGRGPFARPALHDSLLVLQLFMSITAATFLVMGASVVERRKAVRDLRASQRGLETRVEEGTAALNRANERLVLLKQLEEAVGARDALISIASHELRTPLAAMQLHLDLMTRAILKSPDQESLPDRMMVKLTTFERQIGRLSKLIDHLLDVSRITAGRLELALEEVDLAALAREVADRFDEVLRRADCAVSLQAPVAVIGSWDRLRIEQIITNLLSNAAKYGSGHPIDIEVEGDADSARLVVRDHGIGIPPEDQSRIFERFERLIAGREAPGFGLGLWIVRQVVEGLCGQIRLTSAVGSGTTFVVELPRRPPVERPARATELSASLKRKSQPRVFDWARKN
ncbi:MAG TPA: MASE1 domain-containing protein [Polyangiaceae bacterium]|nr:MASE1 domain-containing protein [Polyangiaceae bacterium]